MDQHTRTNYGANAKISSQCLHLALGAGLKQTQIASMCNMSRQAIHIRLKRKRIMPTKYRKLVHLVNLGMNIKSVSAILKYKSYGGITGAMKHCNIRLVKSRTMTFDEQVLALYHRGILQQRIKEVITNGRSID